MVRSLLQSGRRLALPGFVVAVVAVTAVYGLSQRSVVRPVASFEPPAAARSDRQPVAAFAEARGLEPPERQTERGAVLLRPAPTEKEGAQRGAARPSAPARRRVTRQTADPRPLVMPRVTSILVGPGRQLATVDGVIVAVGDRVGRRIVDRIETDAVVLKDPSGAEVRVPLRPGG